MTLTIDNFDGHGPIDYSGAICADVALKLTRVLNKPSILGGMLEVGSLAVPARRGRIIATAANGTTLFTGYLATEPVGIYAGVATTGAVYRYQFSAMSDEWLLDKLVLPIAGVALDTPVGSTLAAFTQRIGPGLFATAGVAAGPTAGVFEPVQTGTWSGNAGALADSAYTAYRALNGGLTLQLAGAETHVLDFDTGMDASGGAISVAALKTACIKELANDVTLSGAIEPGAYINETFAGDGTTTVFDLTEAPFRPVASARALLTDSFNESVIDQQIWSVTDPGSHLGLTAAGLTLTGGNGFDGQTTLTGLDLMEMGGALIIEAGNVVLSGANLGILCGLYNGPVLTANCFAGYSVRQSAGTNFITPIINGAETGTTYTVAAGHSYTLRIRLRCAEVQRVAADLLRNGEWCHRGLRRRSDGGVDGDGLRPDRPGRSVEHAGDDPL